VVSPVNIVAWYEAYRARPAPPAMLAARIDAIRAALCRHPVPRAALPGAAVQSLG